MWMRMKAGKKTQRVRRGYMSVDYVLKDSAAIHVIIHGYVGGRVRSEISKLRIAVLYMCSYTDTYFNTCTCI